MFVLLFVLFLCVLYFVYGDSVSLSQRRPNYSYITFEEDQIASTNSWSHSQDISILKGMGLKESTVVDQQYQIIFVTSNIQTSHPSTIVMHLTGLNDFSTRERIYSTLTQCFGTEIAQQYASPTWSITPESLEIIKDQTNSSSRFLIECDESQQMVSTTSELSVVYDQMPNAQIGVWNDDVFLYENLHRVTLRYYIMVLSYQNRVQVVYHYNGNVFYRKKPGNSLVAKETLIEHNKLVSLFAFYDYISIKKNNTKVTHLLHSVDQAMRVVGQLCVLHIDKKTQKDTKGMMAEMMALDVEPSQNLHQVKITQARIITNVLEPQDEANRAKYDVLSDFYSFLFNYMEDSNRVTDLPVNMCKAFDNFDNNIWALQYNKI